MKFFKNKSLKAQEEDEDIADRVIDELVSELNQEGGSIEEMEQKIRLHKNKIRKRILIIALAVFICGTGLYLFITLRTYDHMEVAATYEDSGVGRSSYQKFQKNLLKYSRDGVALINQKGEENWNHPCQIQSPIIEITGASAAIADQGGNDVLVFQKDGLKGEIHTTLPIEKITVSSQGIVAAILSDEMSPKIICYDAAGSVLVEHKISVTNSGYPVGISLREDGNMLMVSYLKIKDGITQSRLVYYNFSSGNQEEEDYQVTLDEYDHAVIPSVFFLSGGVSAAVGDQNLYIYQGQDKPELVQTIELSQEVKSVFHNDKYIGVLLKTKEQGKNELRVYNKSGRTVLSETFKGEYTTAKLINDQVLMYDENACMIFNVSGIKMFEGNTDEPIMELFPITGVHKYLLISSNGVQEVRLAK